MSLLTMDTQQAAESAGLIVRDHGCVEVYDAAREDEMPLAVFFPPPGASKATISTFANCMVAGCAVVADQTPNRAEVAIEVGAEPETAETGIELEIVTAQRYFTFEDGATYWIVAADERHALDILDQSIGAAFGEDGVQLFSDARDVHGEPLELTEIPEDRAALIGIAGGIWDEPGRRAMLTDADPGDYFSSEY